MATSTPDRCLSKRQLRAAAATGHIEKWLWFDAEKMDVNTASISSNRNRQLDPLPTAAMGGRKQDVLRLLNNGESGNLSALVHAAYSGHGEIVSLLLDRGADIDGTLEGYGSALAAATSSGRDNIVSMLLGRGADANGKHGNDESALATAVWARKRDIVSQLLDHGADANSRASRDGSVLASAVWNGDANIVSLLLDRGADVNSRGNKFGSVLATAAWGGKVDIVSLLLDRGADVNDIGNKYGSVLATAIWGGDTDTVSLLLDRGADANIGGTYGSALATATWGGTADIVSLLLDRGADINSIGGQYGSALATAASSADTDMVSQLLDRGADVNTGGGEYGSALATAAWRQSLDIVSLLLDHGADANIAGGKYGCALGAATHSKEAKIVSLLVARGADVNTRGGQYGSALAAVAYNDGLGGETATIELLLGLGADINLIVGGQFGTALGAAIAARACTRSPLAANEREGPRPIPTYIQLLLDRGTDVNLVGCKYGSALGQAAYEDDEELVQGLLACGADAFHVGGEYETWAGEYPTALDAARCGKARASIISLLSDIIENPAAGGERDTEPWASYDTWPPFPMPYTGTCVTLHTVQETAFASAHSAYHLEYIFHAANGHGNITPAQADIACSVLNEELLVKALVALMGIHKAVSERLQVWIRNDIRSFISQRYDFGLAYAAARVAWKSFNDPDFNIAVHRAQWQGNAKLIDEARANAIYTDETGQALIKSSYSIMPRRIWDLKSNRVIEFRMLHSEALARQFLSTHVNAQDLCTYPTFWAITHSWASRMDPVLTSINQYQWPIPLPEGLDLDNTLRVELLNAGGAYVWLDVLCLRQNTIGNDLTKLKESEWNLDVPTIGNIYRKAAALVRYFNGLGQPFKAEGWDNPRHWLRRAWTLQEIRTENTTINGACNFGSSVARSPLLMNTKGEVDGVATTLRQALHPVVKLAAQVDSPSGCSVYDLVKQMSKRHSTQPIDKVAGLLYLLRTTQLPTYDGDVSAEDAWTRCFHVLPFARKIEILFDFPYRARAEKMETCSSAKPNTTYYRRWFPTWRQLMVSHLEAADGVAGSGPYLRPHSFAHGSLFMSNIWAISHVRIERVADKPNEYDIRTVRFVDFERIFGFFCPYQGQYPVESLAPSKIYTLATSNPDQSYNWAVCELVEDQNAMCKTHGITKMVEIEVLRKVGVLRTESCSELVLGVGRRNSALEKINALFI